MDGVWDKMQKLQYNKFAQLLTLILLMWKIW